MKIATIFRCPDCGGKLRVAQGDPLPEYCSYKNCGVYLGPEEEKPFVPAAPMIRSKLGISADQTYRQYEDASIARAEAAKPMIEEQLVQAGIPREVAQRQAVEQANQIKVTNLKDHMADGENAAIPSEYRPSAAYEQQVTMLGADPRGSFAGGMSVAGVGAAPINESGAKIIMGIQGGRMNSAPPNVASVAGFKGGFGKAG